MTGRKGLRLVREDSRRPTASTPFTPGTPHGTTPDQGHLTLGWEHPGVKRKAGDEGPHTLHGRLQQTSAVTGMGCRMTKCGNR